MASSVAGVASGTGEEPAQEQVLTGGIAAGTPRVASFTYPFVLAHEIGHLLLDAGHIAAGASGRDYQLMRGGGSSGSNSVNAAKRIAAVSLQMSFIRSQPRLVNQEQRMRTQVPAWLAAP